MTLEPIRDNEIRVLILYLISFAISDVLNIVLLAYPSLIINLHVFCSDIENNTGQLISFSSIQIRANPYLRVKQWDLSWPFTKFLFCFHSVGNYWRHPLYWSVSLQVQASFMLSISSSHLACPCSFVQVLLLSLLIVILIMDDDRVGKGGDDDGNGKALFYWASWFNFSDLTLICLSVLSLSFCAADDGDRRRLVRSEGPLRPQLLRVECLSSDKNTRRISLNARAYRTNATVGNRFPLRRLMKFALSTCSNVRRKEKKRL